VADLLDGLARYLDSEGVLDYDAAGVTGNTFIEVVPQTPNRCVSLSIYGGEVPDSKLGYDSVAMQVRTRGTNDPRVSRSFNQAIYDKLHGLGQIELPDGTYVILCVANQSAPQYIGVDSNGRHEHTLNYMIEVRSVTAHRV
jgi:hypothetical protein